MLVNFTETFMPDNRFKCLCDGTPHDLTVGATVVHTFSFPFKFTDYIKECSLIYREGLNIILEKTFNTSDLIGSSINREDLKIYLKERPTKSDLLLTLTPEETMLFRLEKLHCLDTTVQVKIITVEDEIFYNTPEKIKVYRPTQVIDYESEKVEPL